MDLRENIEDAEEFIRSTIQGMMKGFTFAMPGRVTKDSDDGHVATVQPTIKRAITDPQSGEITYEDYPDHPDAPISHLGGGGVTHTFPNKKDDTGTLIYVSRCMDSWFNSDGTQQPMEDRLHSIQDCTFLSGIRSVPRKLEQVSKDSAQTRSDDKKNVIDHHPTDGTKIKNVDPSTQAASENFDPFSQATKFFEHIVHPGNGHALNATDGGTTHSVTNTHSDGPKMAASNGAHTVSTHPTNGVGIVSSIAHTIQAPNAQLSKEGTFNALQNVIAGQNVNAGQAITAAFGAIGGMMMGGGGGGAMSGSFSATGNVAAGATVAGQFLQTTDAFVFAALPLPSMVLRGARAYIIDAPSATPTYMSVAAGAGTYFAPVICDGITWRFG